jgi:O-succinylbenzoate synthase
VEPRAVIDDLLATGPEVGRITLHRVRVPLRRALRSSHGVEDHRESTLVRVDLLDGAVGWGECVALARPTYTDEYADGAFRVLRDLLGPTVLRDGSFTGPLPVVGHPMAVAALEGAVVDACLRSAGRSLVGLLGAQRRSVPTAAVVGRPASIDELLAQIGELVEQSVEAVSLKIAPGWDIEPVRAVHRTWPSLVIGADGNGAYSRHDVDDLAAVGAAGLAHLEQPLPADDLVGLADLRRVVDVPIALDESASSRAVLEVACRLGAVDAVNLKPARVGGLRPTVDMVRFASGEGLALYCGGMLETGVGRAHALAVAALEALAWPTHLGPSDRYFERDLTEPFVLRDDARLDLPTGTGIGVDPDAGRLAAVEIDRAVVSGGS